MNGRQLRPAWRVAVAGLLAAAWLCALAAPAHAGADAAAPGMAGTTAPPAATATPGTSRLRVYFNSDRLSTDPTDCSAVFPVDRRVARTTAVASAALRQLFAGPTPEERAAGYRSPFSAATAGLLKGLRIVDGTAYVNLHDLRAELAVATSSCGAAEFQSQVLQTLLQFPSIRRVVYAIEGEPRMFYEWMNESCGGANDRCDRRSFRR